MPYFYQEAEQKLKEEFYNGTHDAKSTLDIPKIVNDRLIADNKIKDPEYYGHRPGVVHATSLSKCLRGVIYEMLGAKPDEETDPRKLGVFKAGMLFEDFIIDCLRDKVVHTQREYEYHYKNITLVGRSDYTIMDDGVLRLGENKSVNSDSFWYRQREGTLIAWQNQIQLETYMWLERILPVWKCNKCRKILLTNTPEPVCCGDKMVRDESEKLNDPHGIFSYISKDDCTVIGAAIKYNPIFVNEIIGPALDIINEGYIKKDPNIAPVPALVVYNESKNQYQKNWLATYCNYHSHCAGAGWGLEATALVTTRNKELRAAMPVPEKKKKPVISVE